MAIEFPDTEKFIEAIKPKPIGFQTLFVNSDETQRLAYWYGLPQQAKLENPEDFRSSVPNPPNQVDPDMIFKADLLRYNLGKFYYSNHLGKANQDRGFVDNRVVTTTKPLLLDLPKPPKHVKEFNPTLQYMIGQPATYDWTATGYQFVKTKYDLQNLEFGSETLMILILPDGDSYIKNSLENLNESLPPIQQFAKYLSAGKSNVANSISPQYLGLGFASPDAEGFEFIPGGIDEFIYNDHTFIFNHPYPENEIDNLPQIKVLYCNVNSSYNFYQAEYEKTLSNTPAQVTYGAGANLNTFPIELWLPNFLTILEESKTAVSESEIENKQFNKNISYAVHSTLGGIIPINVLRPLETQSKDYEETLGSLGNQYLDAWSKAFVGQNQPIIFQDLSVKAAINKYRNIIYSLDVLKNEDMNISKKSFPFYNEINFNTDTTNQMADMLKNAKLFDVLVLDYINKTTSGNEGSGVGYTSFHSYQELTSFDFVKNKKIGNAQDPVNPFTSSRFSLSKNGFDRKIYDFDLFVEQTKNLTPDGALVNSAAKAQEFTISVGGEEYSDAEFDIFKKDPLTQLINKMTFLSNYAAFIKNNLRTYKDIVQGKAAYSETLFYRIEKRDDNGNVIQNFYVLNDSELDDVNLIDTQIKYGKAYKYHIYAVQLVVGNEYFYKRGPDGVNTQLLGPGGPDPLALPPSNPYSKDVGVSLDFSIETDFHYNLIADTKQSVKLIEAPYVVAKKVRAQEAPPVPPDINFVPYQNVDNQILITFNVGIGEYYDSYIPILENDLQVISNSSVVDNNGQVLFKTEGDVTSYDMFRISELRMPDGPSDYTDFGTEGNVKRITLNRSFGEPTFVDTLLPNTKYWYTFRTNDKKHSSQSFTPPTVDFSNPTDVYEIQLINNGGAIYLLMQTYDISFFNKQKLLLEKTKTKPMRKYLHIKPSFEQTVLNTEVELGGTNYEDEAMADSIKDYVEKDENESVAKFKLGYKEKSVFGNLDNDTNNKFKVRLTSKKTGRKIDIFLRFKKPTLEK